MPILKSDASVAPYIKQGAADTKTLPVYLDRELSRIQTTLNQLTLLANQVYTVEPKTKLNGMVVNNKAPWNPLGTGDGLVRWNGAAWVAVGGGGTTGATGPIGPPGYNGEDGIDGTIGPQGNQGATGLQGLTGTDGQQGPPGLDGEAGIDGIPGATGNPGTNGINGLNGIDGILGPAGRDGEDGNDGRPGQDGIQGLQGIQGIQGIQGLQGLQGDKGVPGYDGEDGLPGPLGPQGNDGNLGPQGQLGPPGYNGEDGVDGTLGPQGNQGIQGTTGATGLQGDRGPPGIMEEYDSFPIAIPVGNGALSANSGPLNGSIVTVQSPYAISSAPSVVHSVSSITLADHYLECITTDLSYVVGDKIAFGTLADGATASLKPTGFWNATNVGSVNPSGLPLVMNKTTFAQTAITAANWKIMARVFN